MSYDVAIVGGGPAGLACSIEAAQRGFRAVVLERRVLPCDKACGEGLMPSGVRALEALGVRALLPREDCAPIEGIRYVQEDGSAAEGRLPEGGGLGVRRTALAAAMAARARALGVEIRERTEVRGHQRTGAGVAVETDTGTITARLLIAADGLASARRRAEGLEEAYEGPRRFGLRQHFARAAWSPFVEVHFAEGVEAYITPAGDARIGVAFLWEAEPAKGPASFDALLAKFPALVERLAGVPASSPVRGAGPLLRKARAPVADRFVLVGDAAGYVDAITGEGLSLAFACSGALGEVLPEALARGATEASLAPYARVFRREFLRYSILTQSLLALCRRPAVRRHVVRFLGKNPRLFERILAVAVG